MFVISRALRSSFSFESTQILGNAHQVEKDGCHWRGNRKAFDAGMTESKANSLSSC